MPIIMHSATFDYITGFNLMGYRWDKGQKHKSSYPLTSAVICTICSSTGIERFHPEKSLAT